MQSPSRTPLLQAVLGWAVLLFGLGLFAMAFHAAAPGGSRPHISTPPPGQPMLRAATWFGEEWAVNFWNSDLEATAQRDFRAIRADGFNSVVILVPWAGFAPSPTNGSLDARRVERLRRLMRLAASEQLDVVLRAAYAWDAADPLSGARLQQVWTDPDYYQGWLDYFDALWRAVGTEPNLRFAFFSWEDLWAVTGFGDAPLDQRLLAAQRTGFRDWLRANRSLAEVSPQYATGVADWDTLPVPQRDEAAFGLFLEFVDYAWIQRFFIPAQRRFEKLSMEIRIDSDPVWSAPGQLLRWHSHRAAWDLPGAEWTSIYWSPAMGGANQGESLTASESARRLNWMLQQIRDVSGRKKIFIDQFLVEDFTPGFERNGRMPREAVPHFLLEATPVLQQYTHGYALWTWRDYHHNAIMSSDFFTDAAEWSRAPGIRSSPGRGLTLAPGDWLRRDISEHEYHVPGGPKNGELCLTARSSGGGNARVHAIDGGSAQELGSLHFTAELSEQCLRYPVPPFMPLELRAVTGTVALQRVRATGFVQPTGVRAVNGEPKAVLADWRALNERLDQATPAEFPLAADGWMGRSYTLELRQSKSPREQALLIDMQADGSWATQPEISVSVDGVPLARFTCASDTRQTIPLRAVDATRSRRIALDASFVRKVPGDDRPLSCLIRAVRIETISPETKARAHDAPRT